MCVQVFVSAKGTTVADLFLPGYHFAVDTWWQSGRRLVFANDVRFIGF